MAKKAVKKQASTAKAPKAMKTTEKAAAAKITVVAKKGTVKAAPPAKKAAAKPAAKVVATKAAPAKVAKKVVAKPEAVKKEKAKAIEPKVEIKKTSAKAEKVLKPVVATVVEKTVKAPKAAKTVTEDVEVVDSPKKEKKVKIDRAGMNEEQAKWHELHEKYKAIKPAMYSISAQFEAKTPIAHKIFGWGFILSNEYDRLEVLFEDGKRMLISNRKL